MTRLTILGSGTSMGVPVIGCSCAVCTSSDPRNIRLRAAAAIEAAGQTILIDAGPDLRAQALAAGLTRVDAVLLTHAHADHVNGIDDLRAFNFAMRRAIPLFGNERTIAQVREQYAYAFAAPTGSTQPQLELHAIAEPFALGGVPITPLPVLHGDWPILGYRVGDLAYITDASAIEPATRDLLRDLDALVLNALRFDPHPMHFSLAEALDVVADLAPRRAWLTHMAHAFDHATVEATLPPHVRLAYDGLVIDPAA